MAFALNPRLKADTHFIKSLAVSDLLIMKDARYPWVILVPRIEGARELHDLDQITRELVWQEVTAVGQAIAALPMITKINTGALGNIVEQLHIHVVGRHSQDPAWPGPVWGHSPGMDYAPQAVDTLGKFLSDSLSA
jgi:diadenosine tetraphosphate (Ap4A) HIT family hydrolase